MESQEIIERLRSAGHRMTQPRQVVIEVVAGQHSRFTAGDLCDAVASRAPSVGRATVFRTMQLLSEAGVLERVHGDGGRDAYVVDARGHHHHMVCGGCGAIVSLESCGLDDFLSGLAERYGFVADGHFVEVYGRCQQCRMAAAGTDAS
ncbi:MAG: Fur family transcriptional regulator [Chloroflexi bacterium]|nr:Fur family transcriptional regulator [Chloroflexota bacterium]